MSSSNEYENATVILITHKDKDYSNSTLKISCSKSRKLNEGKFSKWGELKFRFEITNNDMTYGSPGSYRCISMTRSEFLSWLISIQQAVKNPNCYTDKINVKRRIDKNDFVIKFAESETLNCDAVLVAIVTNQSTYSKVGINGILFNQFLLQLGKMAVDILNFELNFDQSILMYKNNQYIEYQLTQNQNIIELLANQQKMVTNTQYVDNRDNEIKNDGTVSFDQLESKVLINNDNTNVDSNRDNNNDIPMEDVDDIEETIDNDDNTDNLIPENDILDNLEDVSLESLFEARQEDIDNPKEISETVKVVETALIKYCQKHEKGIEVFNDIVNKAQGKSFQETGLQYYYSEVLNDSNFYLPCCIEEDRKSLQYLSQVQYYKINSNYRRDETVNDVIDIPLFYQMIDKKNWKLSEQKNIYDILAVQVYMYTYSNILTSRETNAIKNKSIFTKFFRLIFEPLYMSFILSMDQNTSINDTIYHHYEELNRIDFFKNWNDIADELSINIPNSKDIKIAIDKLMSNIEKYRDINLSVVHDTFFNKKVIILPYKNKINQEHIFDIAHIEGVINNDKTSEAEFDNFVKQYDLPKSTIVFLKEIYVNDLNTSNVDVLDKLIKDEPKIKSALYRYIVKFSGDAELFTNQSNLLKYIDELDNNDFKLVNLPDGVDIHAIPDNILIALDMWKPSEDLRVKSFSQFIEIVKNSWRTKIDIISDYMSSKKDTEMAKKTENVEWGNFI